MYCSQGVGSLSTVTTCTVCWIQAAPDFGLTTKWTTKCGRFRLLFFVRLLVDPNRQISLNQTWPQNCVRDGLPRTQLTALLSSLIAQRYKKCNNVDENSEKFYGYISLTISTAITNISQSFFWIFKTCSMRLQLTFYWNVTYWQITDMFAGNTNDWERLKHFL